MKTPRSLPARIAGTSLIEVLLAMGVLAVALPLVAAVLARSGQGCAAAQAETRCGWILPACLDEIEAAHTGSARFLPDLTRGQSFPAPGDVLVLAFADDGRALGCVGRDAYLSGLGRLRGESVRYLASLRADPAATRPNMQPGRALRVTLEFPAAAPLAKRHHLEFFTRLP